MKKLDNKIKTVVVGKGFLYFKNKQDVTYNSIADAIGYGDSSAAQQITYKSSCNTTLIEKLAHVFGVTPAEFIEQCTVEGES